MFSIQKATLLGITALTTIGITGIINVNSAQAAITNRSQSAFNSSISLNPSVNTGNSSLIQLPKEGIKVATFIRRAKIKKKNKVKYRVGSETNNNQPASVTNPARERTSNNNQSTSNTNFPTIRKSIRKMQKIQN
ncbi:MAG: hypothetical protein MJK14_27125 [Rivularia sp. ALOHA_DT_140]|nr:hypothetical protein [Rivularia sp. ALOHA_DT_140]